MSLVQTNKTSYSINEESSLGVAAGAWTQLQPNNIPEFGRKNQSEARNPISKSRQRQGGEITTISSGFAFDGDLTQHHLDDCGLVKSALRAKPTGPGLTDAAPFRPTAVTATGYTVASGGALAAGTLIFASGFTNAANNGFKVVTTSISTEIRASGLVVEANTGGAVGTADDAKNATVRVCGIQAGTTALSINASGNLASDGTVDFTTLGLTVGQWIFVGGDSVATRFATAADFGFARIKAIAANLLTLDKRPATWTTDAGTGKTIQLFYGAFLRNYDIDDAKYNRYSQSVEGGFPDLGGIGTPKYGYPAGNVEADLTIDMPLASLGKVQAKWVGTTTPAFTTSRATNAANARKPVLKSAYNTSSRFVRLRATKYDETGLTSYFEAAQLTIKNGTKPKYVLGSAAALDLLDDNCEVDLSATIVFTDSALLDAAQNYEKITCEFALHNDDGGLVVDLPAVRLGDDSLQLRRGDAVAIQGVFHAEQDTTLGFSVGFSFFSYLPTLAASPA